MSELSEAIREAMEAGDDDRMRDLARLAIAAFGRAEGSGVVGVDVQRIRRTLGLTAGQQPPNEDGSERRPIDREQLTGFERHLRRELERDLIERTETITESRTLPPGRWPSSTGRCRPDRPRIWPSSTASSRR
jgi:hypothetical protein